MSASEHVNKTLFHGTGAVLGIGETITPRSYSHSYGGHYAFATTNPEEADSYAYRGMLSKGTMFGSIYEVEPIDPSEDVESFVPSHTVSQKGFKVKKIHKYVTREN